MEQRTIHDLTKVARVAEQPECPRALRRQRLQRLAALLENYRGQICLLSRIEYMSSARRRVLRADQSPLALAYADPLFRAQGLESDRLGDAVGFFGMTKGEAHQLLCDCHYAMTVTPAAIAVRARAIAARQSFGEAWTEAWSKLHGAVMAIARR